MKVLELFFVTYTALHAVLAKVQMLRLLGDCRPTCLRRKQKRC